MISFLLLTRWYKLGHVRIHGCWWMHHRLRHVRIWHSIRHVHHRNPKMGIHLHFRRRMARHIRRRWHIHHWCAHGKHDIRVGDTRLWRNDSRMWWLSLLCPVRRNRNLPLIRNIWGRWILHIDFLKNSRGKMFDNWSLCLIRHFQPYFIIHVISAGRYVSIRLINGNHISTL